MAKSTKNNKLWPNDKATKSNFYRSAK
jgi:hypothetical protein